MNGLLTSPIHQTLIVSSTLYTRYQHRGDEQESKKAHR